MFNLITLDGYFAEPDGGLDWHNVDAEFGDFAEEQLSEIGTLLFGRKTYEMMAEFWSSEEVKADDERTATPMNALPKVVVSHKPLSVNWENSQRLEGDLVTGIQALKAEDGKDIALFGSANLATSLIEAKLIDEFRILVNPIVLGAGQPLFQNLQQPLHLELIASRTFKSGNVLLTYKPKN